MSTHVFTKEFADKWFCFERFQVIKVFSCANKCDGTSGGSNTVMEGGREGGRKGGKKRKKREGGKGAEGYKTFFALSTESATGSCDLRTECSAPLSMAIQFCHNHGSHVYFILECSCL